MTARWALVSLLVAVAVAADLPRELVLTQEVVYQTALYRRDPQPVAPRVTLERVTWRDHDGYAEVSGPGVYAAWAFDLVDRLDLADVDFAQLTTMQQYIARFGDYADLTDGWGDGTRMHFSKTIRKIAVIDGKPLGVSIFLHVSRAKGETQARVDEAIVRVLQ